MDANRGAEGPLTSAERVAILDRQLEESTRDFDGIIYDEEQRQREADRARTTQTSESSADTNTAADEESTFGGGVASTGSSSVGGGIGGSRGNAPPTDGAKYPPPGDIPLATMTMWSRDNCAKPPCERQILRFAKSCGMSIANTKA